MDRLKSMTKKQLLLVAGLLGILIGLLIFFSLRVIFAKDDHTHYHANFGLFINGKRDTFSNFTFYEEVQSCSIDDANNPKHRVHMHNQENDVVHVHEPGVTWSQFFTNLNYGLTDKLVETDDGLFVDDVEGKQLTFILNGKPVDTVANRVIASDDTLLISYGIPQDADSQYKQISHSADEHNHKPDPATCSTNGELKFSDRLKQALDFTK